MTHIRIIDKNVTTIKTKVYQDGTHYRKEYSSRISPTVIRWTKSWYDNEDRLHRDTNLGPAYIYFEMDSPNSMDNCGYYPPSSTIKSIYYLHGEMIRSDDGPTHIDESSVATYIEKIEYWKENDILHNDTGPAQILYNGVFLDTSEVGDPTMPTYVPIKSVWYNKGIEGKTIEHQK